MNNDAPTLTPGRFGRVEMILIDDPGRFILRLLLATLVLSRYLASGYMIEIGRWSSVRTVTCRDEVLDADNPTGIILQITIIH